MTEIELGDKVRCKHTGFTGIAVHKSEFINGCIQFGVVPRVGKDNKVPDALEIDSKSLEVVKKKKKEKIDDEEESTGGPMHLGKKQKGF